MDTPPPSPAPRAPRRRLFTFALKLTVTAAALAFAFSRTSLPELAVAVRRLHPSAVVLAVVLTLANLVLAALRWRILLAAYGATTAPSLAFLARAQLVGHFYNTFLPANVTGDLLRAHVTRTSFPAPATAYMVVVLERFFGLAGLFTLGALTLTLHPLPGVLRPELLALLALAAACTILLLPFAGRTLARRLPARLAPLADKLPAAPRPALLALVLALAVVTHTLVALTGHVLVAAIAPQVSAPESLVLIPLAMIATFLPFSVAGLGVRETAFVLLFAQVGVSSADATAASLAFFAVYALVAALGGLMHLARPLEPQQG
ncbi:MAG: lysylphosphatidylglycerol synthase transmembrane domain-containing protein [Polyangiaceae bacterium]